MFIKSNFKSFQIDDLCVIDDGIECLFVDCKVNNTRLLFGVAYRPPQGNNDYFVLK